MASPWNQHCVNCIGTLSFPIALSLYYKAWWCSGLAIHAKVRGFKSR